MKICGDTLPAEKVTSSGSEMTVKFKSDRSVTKGGFHAEWKMVKMTNNDTKSTASAVTPGDFCLPSQEYEQEDFCLPYPGYEQENWSSKYSVDKLLTRSLNEDHSSGNYWLGPEGKSTAKFVLKLRPDGGLTTISKISLVNTHNGFARDRSTKEFAVYVDERGGPMRQVLRETLPDSRQMQDPLPLMEFDINPIEATFVTFQLLSFYGPGGGGLQYFTTDAC